MPCTRIHGLGVAMTPEEVVRGELAAWDRLDVDAIRQAVARWVGQTTSMNLEILNVAVAGHIVMTERVDHLVMNGETVHARVMGVFEIDGDKSWRGGTTSMWATRRADWFSARRVRAHRASAVALGCSGDIPERSGGLASSSRNFSAGAWIAVTPPCDDGVMDERTFDHEHVDSRRLDYADLLDELRCHTTGWLEARRVWLVREQRRLHVEELAVLRVLDERGRVDDSLAAKDGTSTRDVRRKRATARNLERQPNIANAAANGALSDEQLDRVSDLAGDGDPAADEHWAKEGPGWSPEDLAGEVRRTKKPTMAEAAARRAARMHRFWMNREAGMLDGRYSLPDLDGALVESVFEEMIERMRPAKGQAWDTREHRAADALVELCRMYRDRDTTDRNATTGGYRAHFVAHVPTHGPATVAGIPLPDTMVEALRAEARIEPVLVGDDGEPIVVGRTESVLSEKTKRVVKQRDGHCRYPGCDRRTGLQVHHLWPSSWGGSDDLWNLATVCTTHHAQLAPQGRLLLLGNPNNPAGLSLIDRDDLPKLAELAATQARAGP